MEPICLYVADKKMMSELGQHIRFWAHHQLANEYFHSKKILTADQFELVAWQAVYSAQHLVPSLFRLCWASKHVLGIAATNKFLYYHRTRNTIPRA